MTRRANHTITQSVPTPPHPHAVSASHPRHPLHGQAFCQPSDHPLQRQEIRRGRAQPPNGRSHSLRFTNRFRGHGQCHVAKVDLAVCAVHRRGVTRVTGGTGVISGRECLVAESSSGDSRDAGRLGSAGRGGRRDHRVRGAGTTVGRQVARPRDHVPDSGGWRCSLMTIIRRSPRR